MGWLWALYGLCAVTVAVYLIIEDIRKLSVPLWALILWVAWMWVGLIADSSHLTTVLVLTFVSLGLCLYQRLRKRALMGYADIAVFASLGVFMPLLVTPIYIVLCGVFGLCSAAIWKQKRIPFMPIIFLSFLSICIPALFQNDEQANKRSSSAAYNLYARVKDPEVQRTQRLKEDGYLNEVGG